MMPLPTIAVCRRSLDVACNGAAQYAAQCTSVHCRALHLTLAEQGGCGTEGAGAAVISRCVLHCVVVDCNSRKNLCLLQDEMSPQAVMMAAIKGKGHYGNWRVVD